MKKNYRQKGLWLLAAFLALRPTPAAADMDAEDRRYLLMVEKAIQVPADTNWADLRLEYTKTSFYKPFNSMTFWPAFESTAETAVVTQTPAALKAYGDLRKQNYANFTSHVYSVRATLGRKTKVIDREREQEAMNGLVDSIIASGDGSNMEKSYKVITFEEEKFVVETYLNSKIENQKSETLPDKQSFDLVVYRDPKTKKPVTILFNTTIITSHVDPLPIP